MALFFLPLFQRKDTPRSVFQSKLLFNLQSKQRDMGAFNKQSIDKFLLKSSLPYYMFVVVTLGHTIIHFGFGLPVLVLLNFFGIFPILDEVVRVDWLNPNLTETKELQDSVRFSIPLYLGIVVDWLMTIVFLDRFIYMPLFHQIFGILAIGVFMSSTFLIAHELLHRNNPIDRFIATLHQVRCLYMHYTTEHVYNHHKNVATPLDPASADRGVSLYKFVFTSIVGSYKSALKIDPRAVSMYTLLYIIYLSGIFFIYDFSRVLLAIAAAFGGVWVLESVNYIEHYGLRRKQLLDGSYEKVSIRHSWNAPHRISNYYFFKLQRHSDHHENSLKQYQTLCSYEESPQLPTGYLGCLVLCLFPSKWFQIMDPLVDEYMTSDAKLVGTELKSMPAAVQKIKEFNLQNAKMLLGLLAINIALNVRTYLQA